MKMNKLMMIILCLSLFFLTSCQLVSPGVMNLYDTEIILKQGDSYTSFDYQKSEKKVMMQDFTGIDTLFSIEDQQEVTINIEYIWTKGAFRLLWVTPKNEIIELTQGENHLKLRDGVYRIKVIGDELTCEINWEVLR